MSDLTITRADDEPVKVSGVAAEFAAPSSDGLEYEITGLPGGTETMPVDGNAAEPPDPLALARLRLRQLKFARRVLKYQKREQKCAEARKTRTAKSRRKRTLEKASRKRNRQ